MLAETSAAPLPPQLAMLVLWHLDSVCRQLADAHDSITRGVAMSLIKYVLRKWRLQEVLARNTPVEEIMALTQGVSGREE